MLILLLSVLCLICLWGFVSVIARLDHLDQAMANAIKQHYEEDSFAACVKEGIRRADWEREKEEREKEELPPL